MYKQMRIFTVLVAIVIAFTALGGALAAVQSVQAAPTALFTVNSDGDTADIAPGDGFCDVGGGFCTLRAAIQEANLIPGTDTILFDAMPPSASVIGLSGPLPTITETVNLFGDSHPSGMVELDGNSVTGSGFYITGGGSQVVAFRIHSFSDHGIRLETSGSNTINGNIIGIPAEGIGMGNGGDGIFVNNVGNNTLTSNIISGNILNGIELLGDGATNNNVTGNRIGTYPTGDTIMANGRSGILINNAPSNNIGDSMGNGNLLSGNGRSGIEIMNAAATQNNILGNRIGTNLTGDSSLPNNEYGILVNEAGSNIIGGTTTYARNLISGNINDGILIAGATATGNHVRGNYIGVLANGLGALPNGGSGVLINHGRTNTIGGTGTGMGNLISGNGKYGVEISSDYDIGPGSGAEDNIVQGNLIGTSVAGTADVGNTLSGVHINNATGQTIGGATTAARNLISGNNNAGVQIVGNLSVNNSVQGNYIGTNITGTAALGNAHDGIDINQSPSNGIGGCVEGNGNLISGNGGNGVLVRHADAIQNSICGNLIGLNGTGTAAIANFANGILVDQVRFTYIGGTTITEANHIGGNLGHGVLITGMTAIRNTVTGNHIGTNSAGTTSVPNQGSGVALINAQYNEIGDTLGGQGNLISGNGVHGVYVSGELALGNLIRGNRIGMNRVGNGRLPNSVSGVAIYGGSQNDIGGATAASRNWISGNEQYGIIVNGTTARSNTIRHNYIGTNITGTAPITNTIGGILFTDVQTHTIGGDGVGNLISGNGFGIFITGTHSLNNKIQGNYIGVNSAGTTRLANSQNGIRIGNPVKNTLIGGTTTGTRNIISGNTLNGIAISCDGYGDNSVDPANELTTIQGNYIGVNAAGAAAIPNYEKGIHVCYGAETQIGGTSTGARNIVSGNNSHGIDVGDMALTGIMTSTIQGNYIGTNVNGTAAIPNRSDGIRAAGMIILGGTQPGAGNLVSGNGRWGVNISGKYDNQNGSRYYPTVQGNLIGVNIAGTATLGNGESGIAMGFYMHIGGNSAAARNIISGNGGCGIVRGGSGNTGGFIKGNYIGTDINGTNNLGNTSHGICFLSGGEQVAIGGTASGEGNRIAYNGGDGINFDSFSGWTYGSPIRHNLIYGNAGEGIDLTGDGVTANDVGDSDTGAQKLQNYPVLVGVHNSTSNTIITATLNSTVTTSFAIDYFSSSACDSSGYGEGETFLGSGTATTDSSGNATFVTTLLVVVPSNRYVTMTATDPNGNTSEFSQCPGAPTAVSLSGFTAVSTQPGLIIFIALALLGGTAVLLLSRFFSKWWLL